MLNIYTDVSLGSLADNMIEKIKEAWKNPFEAPIVIFPDSKMAQWFKFRWLENNPVLANLNVKKLDEFIFKSIVDENEYYRLLNSDILRNLIIAYLDKKFEESSNEKIFDEIKDYLCDEDEITTPLAEVSNDDNKKEYIVKKQLNYARLFDFAEMLSSIFLEYEFSRSGEVSNNNGIIDSWINNKDYFEPNSENAKIKEEWQKKIYFDIFSENGCLRQTNEKLKLDNEIFGDYITLPQLFREKYKDIMDSHGSKSLSKKSGEVDSSSSVFIFGFDSMEQFYRNAIKELSSSFNINLYLANPFGDVAKESNNELLMYWGDTGKRNIELWGESNSNRVDLPQSGGVSEDKSCENNLKLLQKAIVEKKKELDCHDSKNPALIGQKKTNQTDDSLVMISAPTRLREVEILHSNICKILLNKKAQIKDIIVASQNLNAYRSVIYQVFNQSPQNTEDTSSQSSALHIHFSIVDSSENESLTHLALKRLFSIKDKGVLNRPDFFDLVRNPVVQTARGILPDEVSNWEGWVSSLNIYRDRKLDDGAIEKNWLTGVKCLLLAKLTNHNIVVDYGLPRLYEPRNDVANKVKEITISPFSDISSSDNESVCRFIDCIDDIEEWLSVEETIKWEKRLDNSQEENILVLRHPSVRHSSDTSPQVEALGNIDSINSNLLNDMNGGASSSIDEAFDKVEKWLFMNKPPKGLGNENIIFQKVIKAKEDLKCQFAAGSESIPWKIFSKSLLNASSKAKYNTGNLFVNGITFMNFVPNRVIPIKYMFLLGIDEKTFPRKDFKNSLDLRHENPIDSGELNSEKDKYAFLNQLLNVKEAIYISYVNKDLQKDEDYYPSSVIDDILRYFKKLGKKLEIENSFNVENRDWKELFTQSALRNKETYEMMMGSDNKGKISSDTSEGLLHNLSTAGNDDSSTDSNNKTYPERVTVYQLRSFLEEPFKARIDRILFSEDEEDAEKIEFEPIEFNRLELSKLRKELVLFCLNNNIESELELNIKLNELNDKNISHFISILDKISLQLPKDKVFADKVKNDLFKDVLLYSNSIKQSYSNYRFSSEVLSQDIDYIFKKGKSIIWNLSGTANIVANKDNKVHIIDLVTSDKIKPKNYLNAYILSLLYLAIYNKNNGVYIDLFAKSDFNSINIDLDSKKAIEYLNNIFKKVFIDNYHKVLPIDFFKEKIENYYDYLGKFENDFKNPWKYFSLSKLFDLKEVSDFNEKTFIDEWNEEKDKQLDLFPEELKENLLPAKGGEK